MPFSLARRLGLPRPRAIWLRLVRKFRSDRYFEMSPLFKAPGWYFYARGRPPVGPYETRKMAEVAAKEYATGCARSKDTGGRLRDVELSSLKTS